MYITLSSAKLSPFLLCLVSCGVTRLLLWKMTKSSHSYHAAVIFVTCCISLQACADNLQYKRVRSIYGTMLRGHVFQEHNAGKILACSLLCNSSIRHHSINYVMSRHLCESNSKTKEARPKDYVQDVDRVYLTRPSERGIKLTLVLLAIYKNICGHIELRKQNRKIELYAVAVYFVYEAKGDSVMKETRRQYFFFLYKRWYNNKIAHSLTSIQRLGN